ncbi:MAG TPA: DNA internalization-related competence protein ComEC/Rec2 [Usitatibacter sp.]|nr:DNA internalization-related competence protein ComEC/Rec2 [Usitatibacter sp.]
MRLFVLAAILGASALQNASVLPLEAVAPWGVVLVLACALNRGGGPRPRVRSAARLLALAFAGLLIGYGWAAWRAEIRLAEALPHALEGVDVDIAGVVASLPQASSQGVRFLLHVEEGDRVPRVVALTWYAERQGGEVLPTVPVVRAGERWRFTVRLKRPRGLSNPHAFDFEPWALQRGIRATGYVRGREAPTRLEARVEGWPYTAHRWRGELRDAMRARLGGARLAGVLVALAVGDQDAIGASDWEVFWRTGVGHLMSISGLHITMLAALAAGLVAFAWVRVPALALRLPARKAAMVAALATAFGYSLLAGYQVPAQRTFCMLAVLAACVLLDRHSSPSRVLALAALAVVALDPWAVLSAGFWLSFGAVASIFFVMGLRFGRRSHIVHALREQAAVSAAMVPMLVALFQELSLVSPLANALAIPLVSLVVVPLTLAGAFLPLPGLLDAAHAVMLLCVRALEWLAGLPVAMLETHAPAAWTVGLALVGCAWLLAPRGFPMRSCGLLWMAPMFLVAPPVPAPGEAWLQVLDVGNGLAAVVRTASHSLAYDAGPGWSPEADSGSRIVVPFLRGEGVRRLDGLVVSHADDDHAGGALSVALSRRPGWLLSPLDEGDLLHLAVDRSIGCVAGHAWEWDGVRFEVLHPARDSVAARRKENDRSCVVRIESGGAAALLAGDIEARAEAELLARDAALRAQVLLVPHHGSKSSSTPGFVERVAPEIAIFSVGHRNRFRHPHESVLARYRAREARVHRTDREGALSVVLPAAASNRVEVRRLVDKPRYWSERRQAP